MHIVYIVYHIGHDFPLSPASPDAGLGLRIKNKPRKRSSSCFYSVLPKETRWMLQPEYFLSEGRFTKERFTSNDLRQRCNPLTSVLSFVAADFYMSKQAKG